MLSQKKKQKHLAINKEKCKNFISTENSTKVFRECSVKFSHLEKDIGLWISQVSAGGLTISDNIYRSNLRSFILHGEANRAPLEILSQQRKLFKNYYLVMNLKNIYNADETELFYRITITNVTNTSKLKPLVIRHYECPRYFKNINMSIFSYLSPNTTAHLQPCDADIDISLEFEDNNNIVTKELLTDDQIIKLILKENNSVSQNINNESNNEEPPTVSIKEDFAFLKKWISFFEQQNSNDFCFKDLIKFKKYIRIVEKIEFMSKKQTKLDSIFSTNMSFKITEVDNSNFSFEINENFELEDNI
ncbi:5796_t:CDS:2 [Diversispora eburnea]|uniref:5796_t:CDS:1 n=1 Tax=Diversispora eburnea TaxID=1213867 RepID=A0A9N8ZPN2_9GLOM|nr:5796_t:CDS:2 [Diversispora eburnea]